MFETIMGSVFYKPDVELVGMLLNGGIEEIKNAVKEMGHPEKVVLLSEIEQLLAEESYLGKLKQEYNMLFFGPNKILAPPYSSIYIEGFGQIETRTTKQVNEIYLSWGAKLNNDVKEPVDHIAFEISFLDHLNNIYKETGNLKAIEQKKEFLNHMNLWVGKFSNQVKTHEKLGFYGFMSEISVRYIEDQLQKL